MYTSVNSRRVYTSVADKILFYDDSLSVQESTAGSTSSITCFVQTKFCPLPTHLTLPVLYVTDLKQATITPIPQKKRLRFFMFLEYIVV